MRMSRECDSITLCSWPMCVMLDMKSITGVEVVVDLVTSHLHHSLYNNITGGTREVLHIVNHHLPLPALCPHFYQRYPSNNYILYYNMYCISNDISCFIIAHDV